MALRLDLRHYETVAAIVELGSMTAAAKELASTQSALSHRLAEAERRLGVRLFDRGSRRELRPTRAGLAVHQAASRALAELERCEASVVAIPGTITARVKLAVGSYDCYHWYPSFLDRIRIDEPSVELDLVIVGDTPGQALAAGAVDLVLAPAKPTGPVECLQAFTDELVLITAPGHPLAGRPHCRAEELAGEHYLTYNPVPTPGFEYDRFIRPAAVYPELVTVVPTTGAIAELVAAGVGVSILSRWAQRPLLEANRLAAVRCSPDGLPLDWHVVLRNQEAADSPIRRIAAALADHVRIDEVEAARS